ncbi:protein kinase [Embleya sp. NPDC050493]|uniref:serine/threonine-protein kinase n=1 Tax=Embleya sp. NPDC050493 TaxID=3363989 RepID=UPI00378981DA
MAKAHERYELTEQLGKGGMGEVWLAFDKHLDRKVAVKFMSSPAMARSLPTAQERFRREARTTARLEHPGVPTVYDVGIDGEGRMFVVMQYVPGRTLAKVLKKRGRFPVAWAAAVAAQVGEVLAYAHGLGVIHRDLKPANLMLTPTGSVKVLDFGIAAALEPEPGPALTGTGVVAGTPGFMAPEQVVLQQASPHSDLYALGCVLYELLAGVAPLTSPNPMGLLYLHVHEEPRPLSARCPTLPPEFADLIMRLLAKLPVDRPGSAEEVIALTAAWIDWPDTNVGGAIEPGPDEYNPTMPYTRRFAARHRVVVPEPQQPDIAAPTDATPKEVGTPASDPDPRRARIDELASKGRFTQAAELLQELLGESGEGEDPTNPKYFADRLALVGYHRAGGQLRLALDGYARLGAHLAAVRPATDPHLLACRLGAAGCLRDLGRTTEALAAYEDLLPIQQQAYDGPRNALSTRFEIAVLHAGAGSVALARDQLATLRDDQRALLAPSDPAHERVVGLLGRLERLSPN